MSSVQERLAGCLAAVGPQPPLEVTLADVIGATPPYLRLDG